MGTKQQHLERIYASGIVAILRTEHAGLLTDVAEALLAGGVDCIEITFTVPHAHKVLETVADRLGQRALLGAGTVLDPETARIALLAGAQFIVSPSTNLDVIRMCRRYDRIVMPGAMTPTEVITAWEAGADIVKIFPCDLLGPGHLKALRGPFPQVCMVPTGGITLETAAKFLEAGAFALGVGTKMVDPRAIRDHDLQSIEHSARQFIAAVADARTKAAV
jgi:2-dehydro-3-deoxyphosphogluconate aldolase / (4S)-4-hydroxy-2-oxoglutarate aldolase